MAAKLVSQQNMTKEFVVVTKNTDCLHKKKIILNNFFKRKTRFSAQRKTFSYLPKKSFFKNKKTILLYSPEKTIL